MTEHQEEATHAKDTGPGKAKKTKRVTDKLNKNAKKKETVRYVLPDDIKENLDVIELYSKNGYIIPNCQVYFNEGDNKIIIENGKGARMEILCAGAVRVKKSMLEPFSSCRIESKYEDITFNLKLPKHRWRQ